MGPHRLLALAAASRRVGYVFLVDRRLLDWGISDTAGLSPAHGADAAQRWIGELEPQVVVTEKIEMAARKGARTKAIIAVMARVAAENHLYDISVRRRQAYASKYEEAIALAARYPEVAAWLPRKRRLFDNEPRSTVLFEALALAEESLKGPSGVDGDPIGGTD